MLKGLYIGEYVCPALYGALEDKNEVILYSSSFKEDEYERSTIESAPVRPTTEFMLLPVELC